MNFSIPIAQIRSNCFSMVYLHRGLSRVLKEVAVSFSVTIPLLSEGTYVAKVFAQNNEHLSKFSYICAITVSQQAF